MGGRGKVRTWWQRLQAQLVCAALGHRWRFVRWTPDGGDLYRCERCRRWWSVL